MGAVEALLVALAPVLAALVPEVEAAIRAGADPHVAARAALARATSYDPGPDAPRAAAIDAAELARVQALTVPQPVAP